MSDDDDLDLPPELADGPDLAVLVKQIEARLLDGEREFTRDEVAERAGVEVGDIRLLWRALGFATVDDDARIFHRADLQAVRDLHALGQIGGIDDDLLRGMTRMIGQSFARLAAWQGQLAVEIIGRSPEFVAQDGGEPVLDLLDRLTPLVSDLHAYVWRRQMTAYFSRVVSNARDTAGEDTEQVVGFVDMAGFTSFTRRSSEAQLRAVLDRFETAATEIVGEHSGQVVKTIGDEVLFVAPTARDGAEIALAMLERAAADDVLPEVRAGLAYGPVVSRLGDVFGQTVNIASRLTALARTDSVLTDKELATRLEDEDGYSLSSMRRVSVRGYDHLRPWRLRRRVT